MPVSDKCANLDVDDVADAASRMAKGCAATKLALIATGTQGTYKLLVATGDLLIVGMVFIIGLYIKHL